MAQVKITETVLRDSHQSLVATRMKTEEMLPILVALDKVGYHSLEAWGGATFDSCLRFLNEDPWERLRKIRAEVKNTKLQMLFRGQNILGYRHYFLRSSSTLSTQHRSERANHQGKYLAHHSGLIALSHSGTCCICQN